MPIREIDDDFIEQGCAACEAVHRVGLDDLRVGVSREGKVDPSVVPLPPCESCGAVEFLIRSSDSEPEHPSPGSFGHLHRLLVDTLHARLVSRGCLAEGLTRRKAKAARAPGKAEIKRWFKDGLKLRRQREQEGDETKTTNGAGVRDA